MVLTNTKTAAVAAAFVAISALGAYGWMRGRNSSEGNSYPAAVISSQPAYPCDASQPGCIPQQSAGLASQVGYAVPQTVYESDGYYPTRMRPIYVRQHEAAPIQVVKPAPRQFIQEQEYYTDSHGRRKGRTKTHSVEIVAGTAAAGAVIGALAGGGKGAAIGAASGAGAGFVYDRLTHKH